MKNAQRYDSLIIADPNGSAWAFAQQVHSILAKHGFGLSKVIIKRFHDGEIKPKIEQNVRSKKCFFIHDSRLPADTWLQQLALISHTLKNSSAADVALVLPHMRFSRQDRKDESRVPISAKVLADIIGLYANRVLTIDVHNPAIVGFYDIPVDNLYSFTTAIDYLKKHHPAFLKNAVVMSPDAGGTVRARNLSKRLGNPDIAIGYKVRSVHGSVEELRILGDINHKNVLLVDDMIDSGGTLIKAINAAKALGAKQVYAFATHGIFSEGTDKFNGIADSVLVTDSLSQKNTVEVVSVAPLFARAILRISRGESLSELFE